MSSTKIGIIGCGKQAPKHIAGFRATPGVELLVADIDPQLARSLGEQEHVAWAEHPQAVFADPEVRAVSLCTPTHTHAALIEQAVANRKDYFCEKPLSLDLAEARRIVALTREADRIGMVGYFYRFADVFQEAARLFGEVPRTGASPVLGRVLQATLRLGGYGSHQVWKHRSDSGGGATNEMMVHLLDLALWWFGPAREARALLRETYRPQRVIRGHEEQASAEDYVLAHLKMESGVEVVCQADLISPAFTQRIEVQGENGTLVASVQQETPSFVHCVSAAGGYPAGRTALDFGVPKLFDLQMAAFVDAVLTHRQPALNTLEDSLLVMDVLDQIKQTRIA